MAKEDIEKANISRTPEERQEIARKGGIASGEARRRRKSFSDVFETFLNGEYADKKGKMASGAEVLGMKVIEKALKGDLKAFELIRDTVGEKPIDKVAKVDITPEVRNEVEALVEKYETGHGDQDT